MIGYSFTVSCPCCGGLLEQVNQSRDVPNRHVVILLCRPCKREMTLTVDLVMRAPRALHGTPAGWSQHHRDGEDPCDECKAAKNGKHIEYTRARKLVPA